MAPNILLIAALAVAQSAVATVKPTTGKWVLNYAPTHCTLLREPVGNQPGFAIQTRPFADEHDLILLLPRTGAKAVYVQGKLMANGKETIGRWMTIGEPKQAPHRVVDTHIKNDELENVSAGGSLRLLSEGQIDVTVGLPGMAKALAALKPCEDDLARRWGVERTWVTPPKPLWGDRSLVTSEDYPQDALDRNQAGSVRVLLSLSEGGKVTDCRVIESSNSGPLDQATCRTLQKRATFAPALDGGGKPVSSKYLAPRVRYILE